MPINRGSEDSIRDHPDAPKRLRRKSRTLTGADLAALKRQAVRLKREAEAKRAEAKRAEALAATINVQGELL